MDSKWTHEIDELELKDELFRLGVEIDQFSKDTIVINSYPISSANLNAQDFVEACLESFKNEVLIFFY